LKQNPGKYNFGSIGAGSLSHLAMEAIALKSGTQIVHVPYPSSPAAVTALLRNDVQMVCLPAISVTPQAAAGKLKILAVSTAQRSSLLPGIPTLKEAGIDVEADAWSGLIAPAKTPPAVIEAVRAAVAEALNAPDVRQKLAAQIMEPIPSTPAQFRARIDADIARWEPVIKAAHIKPN
jgi:tripartite-type tricarboxylate transporter receptor subunit TctC